MFTTHPYIPLTDWMSPVILQGYIVLMVLAVVLGTVFALVHGKKSDFSYKPGSKTGRSSRRYSAPPMTSARCNARGHSRRPPPTPGPTNGS